jgi:8-oxo-dGTP pyrophosphatase MutT (NUDIX family)
MLNADERPPPWREESAELVYDAKVFRVHRHVRRDPRHDRTAEFHVLECVDWVNVVPVTGDGRVLLIEQFRHGVREVTIEVPGGMVDRGETPREAARRELLEETGYAPKRLERIGRIHPNPAILTNVCHTYLARDIEKVRAPSLDGNEDIRVRLVPTGDAERLVAAFRMSHALTVVAFHFFDLWRRGAIVATDD